MSDRREHDTDVPGLRPEWTEALVRGWRGEGPSLWLTRFVVLRMLGLVYLVAFLVAANQVVPLIGSQGLTPISLYLPAVEHHFGSFGSAFFNLPSLFWFAHSDGVLLAAMWLGVVLSAAVLCGYANSIVLSVLWLLYLSLIHVGQRWYGYGWEMQLCETGFLAIFLVPLLDGRPFPRRPPPTPVIWLFRWLIVRIMLGAGLIKLRGDACWTELTCLYYHFETQPIPGPLTPYFNALPHWALAGGVLFNHFAELVAPLFVFVPRRRLRHAAGAVMLALQITLILSGNLAFLNWLTIVPILACFDDTLWRRLLPNTWVRASERAKETAQASRGQGRAVAGVFGVVGLLSIFPVSNLLSSRQAMNRSFEPLGLVNTYGAFGSVGRKRYEIVFEGTRDAKPDARTKWTAYEFKCKPGDPTRRPCWITPYHLRLDWQIWFAAMGQPYQHPWTVHFVEKLLEGDEKTLSLLASNPFPDGPPRVIRAELYRYELSPPGEATVWTRQRVGEWLPPLSKGDPRLTRFLEMNGW
ncbi:MAG: lipase maturation factor family protein [Polyangiaceae bacterium]|nr:lipase maturation factor family protein [Polyangiaceae bacterium]